MHVNIFITEHLRVCIACLGQQATLAVDGWSNLMNEPVVGIAITCEDKTILVDAIDTTGQPHTAEYMSEVTLAGIEKAEDTFKVKVNHVVTDGAANMKRMRDIITESRPEILTYHCQPHLLNLLAKDLQKLQQSNVGKIISVLKYFRNKHAALAELSINGVNKPPLPSETRWNTLRDSLQYFCKNWASLISIIERIENEQNTERRLLESVPLRRAANELLQVFDLIANTLNLLQSDRATIATAAECWLKLTDDIRGLQNDQFLKAAEKRRKEALANDCLLAANLLDHRYKGQRLCPDDLTRASEYVINANEENRQPIAKYIARTGPYRTTTLNTDTDPVTYWTAGSRFGFDSSLCDFALKLAGAVCSSAGLERQFSTLKLTYGSLRTNLSVEKAGKLALCYRTLNA